MPAFVRSRSGTLGCPRLFSLRPSSPPVILVIDIGAQVGSSRSSPVGSKSSSSATSRIRRHLDNLRVMPAAGFLGGDCFSRPPLPASRSSWERPSRGLLRGGLLGGRLLLLGARAASAFAVDAAFWCIVFPLRDFHLQGVLDRLESFAQARHLLHGSLSLMGMQNAPIANRHTITSLVLCSVVS